jgi:uncharacterized protein (UPF0218 family)
MPWSLETARRRGATRAVASKLLSAGYRGYLERLVPEDLRQQLKLPEGSTFADAIAQQVCMRALGQVSKENICFTAITELRETTEGKTAEKIVATGNEELLALAQAIRADPVPPDNSD